MLVGPVLVGHDGDHLGAAVEHEARGTGEAPGAVWHPEVAPISRVRGEAATGKSDGCRLAMLLADHQKVVADLSARFAPPTVESRTANRVTLESADGKAATDLERRGEGRDAWVLSAYRKGERRAEKSICTFRDLAEAAGVAVPARRS